MFTLPALPLSHSLSSLACSFLFQLQVLTCWTVRCLEREIPFFAYISHVAIIPWITVPGVNTASKALNSEGFFAAPSYIIVIFILIIPSEWEGISRFGFETS